MTQNNVLVQLPFVPGAYHVTFPCLVCNERAKEVCYVDLYRRSNGDGRSEWRATCPRCGAVHQTEARDGDDGT